MRHMSENYTPRHFRTSKPEARRDLHIQPLQRVNYEGRGNSPSIKQRKNGGFRPRRKYVIVGVLIALVLCCAVTGGLLARSAISVKSRASQVIDQARVLKKALKDGDATALDASLSEITDGITYIDSEVHSPLWNVAAILPVVGDDIKSVQALGTVSVELVNDALIPVANSLSGVKFSDLIQDQTVNLPVVSAFSSAIVNAAPAIKNASASISELPEPHLPQVKAIFDKVGKPLTAAGELITKVEPFVELLPQMLGANGTRSYLFIAQNNSELRSTGGLPGSWGLMTVTNGKIELGDFITILHQEGLKVSATEEEITRLCPTIHTDPAQVNFTPNFVRVGEMSREYWSQMGYGDVDGVVAIDPIFLQRLLSLTGGYTAGKGLVRTGENASKTLLSDAYWMYGDDNSAQDEFFSSVASSAFKQVINNLGGVGPTKLFKVFLDSAKDGHLLIWMADADEEKMVDGLGASGAISTDSTKPELGVYINDDTYSKISWYASVKTQIGDPIDNMDGTTSYRVTTSITNTIDWATAEQAPSYVSGLNDAKRDVTDMRAYVMLFAPAGGSLSEVSFSDGALVDQGSYFESQVYGLNMLSAHVNMLAGETATITYTVTTAADAVEPLSLRTTPLAQESLM